MNHLKTIQGIGGAAAFATILTLAASALPFASSALAQTATTTTGGPAVTPGTGCTDMTAGSGTCNNDKPKDSSDTVSTPAANSTFGNASSANSATPGIPEDAIERGGYTGGGTVGQTNGAPRNPANSSGVDGKGGGAGAPTGGNASNTR